MQLIHTTQCFWVSLSSKYSHWFLLGEGFLPLSSARDSLLLGSPSALVSSWYQQESKEASMTARPGRKTDPCAAITFPSWLWGFHMGPHGHPAGDTLMGFSGVCKYHPLFPTRAMNQLKSRHKKETDGKVSFAADPKEVTGCGLRVCAMCVPPLCLSLLPSAFWSSSRGSS